MSLRLQAEADLAFILEDQQTGFGWPITITDPDGNSGPFTGFSTDIAQVIDPDTGQAVSGRLASVAVRTSSLREQGFGWPQDVADRMSKPWVVQFDDVNGEAYTFKVRNSNPDRAIGMITLILEVYAP